MAGYWIVDPERRSIRALDLVDGRYVTVGEGSGDTPVTLRNPFPVTVTPSALVDS